MAGQFDDLIPRRSPGGVVIGTHPRDPSKQLSDTRTQQEIALAAATADARAREAKAQADKAEIDAKNAKDQYAAQHPAASTSGVYGPDYLKTLSASDQNMVRALSEGRMAFPQGSALRAPFWQEKLSQVAQFDPTFDTTDYNARAKGRANAISGKLGQSNNALNTAIGHLGQLYEQIGGTASHNFTPLNSVENSLYKTFGDQGVTNFEQTAGLVADELEAAYRNGGGAEGGVIRQLRSLDPNMSQEQKAGVIRNAIDLLTSKIQANVAQYNFGTGGKPTWDMLDQHTRDVLGSPQFSDIRDKYFAAPAHASGAAGPPSGPPRIGPTGGGSPPGALGPGLPDLPNGGPGMNLATGKTRQTFNPVVAGQVEAMIRARRKPEEINTFLRSHNASPIPAAGITSIQGYLKTHPHYANFVDAENTVPTTAMERISASPLAAGVAGSLNAATAGHLDEIGGAAAALTGGDYTGTRDMLDANKHALAATNPTADMLGNVVGGAGSMMGGEALLGRLAPGALALGGRVLGKGAPLATDAAYGALYGSGENNENRGGGAILGGFTGAAGGTAGRAATRGLASLVAPTGGAAAPLYAEGIFPTLGQRAAAATGPVGHYLGRGLNAAEQALQSIPIAGSLVARARQIPRDAYQLGGFNEALGDIGTSLPAGMKPGTEPHAFAQDAFRNAYDSARSGMQFVPDQPYMADLAQFRARLGNGTLDGQQAAQVAQRIKTAVGSRLRGGAMPGDAYKAAASDLADTVREWSRTDPAKASALNDYITIFDGAARRNSHPAAVAALDAADQGYAKLVRIEDASALGGVKKPDGTFTATTLTQAAKKDAGGVRSRPFLRGDALMQDYATAGKFLDDTLPNSGTADRLFTGQAVTGVGGVGASGLGVPLAALAKPGALALSPYLPGANFALTRLMAPRSATLPPAAAAALDALGMKINGRADLAGRLAVPALLPWASGQ